MKRLSFALLLTCSALACSGCATCQNADDYAYPAYGGIWQRTDPTHGRVGSVFAPAGGPVGVPSETMTAPEQEPGELVPTPMIQSTAY